MPRQTKETPAQFASPTIRPKMLAECRADFRLNQVGPQALSLAELLTIVMGKGTADPDHVPQSPRTCSTKRATWPPLPT